MLNANCLVELKKTCMKNSPRKNIEISSCYGVYPPSVGQIVYPPNSRHDANTFPRWPSFHACHLHICTHSLSLPHLHHHVVNAFNTSQSHYRLYSNSNITLSHIFFLHYHILFRNLTSQVTSQIVINTFDTFLHQLLQIYTYHLDACMIDYKFH